MPMDQMFPCCPKFPESLSTRTREKTTPTECFTDSIFYFVVSILFCLSHDLQNQVKKVLLLPLNTSSIRRTLSKLIPFPLNLVKLCLFYATCMCLFMHRQVIFCSFDLRVPHLFPDLIRMEITSCCCKGAIICGNFCKNVHLYYCLDWIYNWNNRIMNLPPWWHPACCRQRLFPREQ